MKNIKKYNLYILTLAITCLSFSIQTFAQKRKSTKKKTISTACLTCLNSFSSETLTFTVNAAKCPSILAKCNKSNLTSKCEDYIYECYDANCATDGACSDEMSNRGLLFGCLKAENQFLPYQCASYISGFAKSFANQEQAKLDAAERAHEQQLKQQEAQIEAEKRAAEEAAANAKAKAAEAEQQAKIKAAEIEKQTQLELEELKYQKEQEAKDAEIARQKKAAEEARNNKPNVKYNNIISAVKKDITTAKTYTSKAYNLLGITKTTDTQKNSVLGFSPQIVEVYGLNVESSAKSKSLVNGSKYKTTANFKCTKDTKESYVKNELKNALNTLTKSRETLSTSIGELEALNADDETTGTISDDKINNLYELQNKLSETINTIETEMSELTTSCETRCKGMSSFSTSSNETKFDDKGLIIENSSDGDYSCSDFDSSSSTDITSVLLGGSTMSSIVGGVGQQVAELTRRVTRAVLSADRALEETEIAAISGNYSNSSTNYAVINSCIQYSLDIEQYTSCIKNVMSSQLTILSRYNDDTIGRDENYNTVLNEFKKSAKVALDLVNSDNYINKAQCEDDSPEKNGCEKESNNISINNSTEARTYAINLSSRLSKAAKSKNNTNSNNLTITQITDGFITFTENGKSNSMSHSQFLQAHCQKYSGKNVEVGTYGTTSTYPNMSGVYNIPMAGLTQYYLKLNNGEAVLTVDNYQSVCGNKR